jgi:hypothetical protein
MDRAVSPPWLLTLAVELVMVMATINRIASMNTPFSLHRMFWK